MVHCCSLVKWSISEVVSNMTIYVNKEVVQVLLDAGADPDQADNNGVTLLFRCVQYFMSMCVHRKEVVQLLLKRGADPNKDK